VIFREYQLRTRKQQLSFALGGFDKDVLERFYSLTTDHASRDIANFVEKADLMDQRKKDYQMIGEFEGASGVTKIQVGRSWSKTLVVGSVIGILLVLILLYVLRT